MGVRVPHRLMTPADVALAPGAPPGGDGVNDLAVGEGVAFPVEVGLQIPGGADLSGPDDEPQPRLIQGRQVGGREHAGARRPPRAQRYRGRPGRPPRWG